MGTNRGDMPKREREEDSESWWWLERGACVWHPDHGEGHVVEDGKSQCTIAFEQDADGASPRAVPRNALHVTVEVSWNSPDERGHWPDADGRNANVLLCDLEDPRLRRVLCLIPQCRHGKDVTAWFSRRLLCSWVEPLCTKPGCNRVAESGDKCADHL